MLMKYMKHIQALITPVVRRNSGITDLATWDSRMEELERSKMVEGMDLDGKLGVGFCECCIEGKKSLSAISIFHGEEGLQTIRTST